MYESLYIEKNKSNRFGVYFYKNSKCWTDFLDTCNIQEDETAVIYKADSLHHSWKTMIDSHEKENILALSNNRNENMQKIRAFFDAKKKGFTFVIFCEPEVMLLLQDIITEEQKISFVCVPITPFALFDRISILPKCNDNGEIICKEIFPKGVYVDVSVLKDATPVEFQSAIAAAFRLAISYKASYFEWMISNMYELLDGEEDALIELLKRGYSVYKERIEKDTAKERCIPLYAEEFYTLLSEQMYDCSEADLWAFSLVCQSYLSWKKELLSMEEYYEIRDMLVFFGLSITETSISADELLEHLKKPNNTLFRNKDNVFIRKIGKLVLSEAPSEALIREALSQIYFDETENM